MTLDFMAPDVKARRTEAKPIYRCRCCGTEYRRGSFRCCAPPAGMPSHAWLSIACPDPKQGGCGKCYRHCQCEGKDERLGLNRPLAEMARQFSEDLRKFVAKAEHEK